MKSEQLKSNQKQLKSKYQDDPDSAIQTLSATGMVNLADLAFDLETPKRFTPAGLHPSSGGDGTFACSVEIMLAAWAGCAGVTFAAVANAMNLQIEKCCLTAEGTMDFKGTLGVDKQAPVGLTELNLHFEIETNEEDDKIEKLISLTEKYCVIHQTFHHVPPCNVSKSMVSCDHS